MEVLPIIAFIAVISMGFLYYTGYGVTRFLSTEPPLAGNELLLTPFMGYSITTTMAYWCGWLGWSIGVAVAVTLVIATLCNLWAFVSLREAVKVREHVAIFVLAGVAFAAAMYPICQSGILGPIGANGDQVLYANVASRLEMGHLPVSPPGEWHPAMQQLALASHYGLPLGFSYLHAIIDYLSRREAHETFAIVTAMALIFAVLAYAVLARCLFGLGCRGILIAAVLAALSPTLMWVHYNSYAMHVMSLGLVPVAFGVAVIAWNQGVRQLFFAALLLSSAFVTYPVAAVAFAVGPLIVYGAQCCVQDRHQLTCHLRRLGLLLALAVVVNLPGAMHTGKFLNYLRDVQFAEQFGDVHHYAQWMELYGLSHLRLPEEVDPLYSVPLLPLLVAGVAAMLALYGAWQTTMMARAALLSLVIIDLTFMIWLHYLVNYPYGYFKALTFATFPAIMALSIGAERFCRKRKNRFERGRIAIVITVSTCLVAVNLVNLKALSGWVTRLAIDFPALLALKDIRRTIPPPARIHIRDAKDVSLLWITYFLQDYRLSLAHYSPYYMRSDWPFYRQVIDTDLVLVDRESTLTASWAIETVYSNHRFKILRKNPGILQHLDFAAEARPLRSGEAIAVRAFANHVVIDNRPFPLDPGVREGQMLRLGIWAPAGAIIQLNTLGSAYLVEDLWRFEWPFHRLPWEMTLLNEGLRTLWIPGWLEVLQKTDGPDSWPMHEDILSWYQEEVIPQSGFFRIRGWYPLEGGKQRWMQQESMALFRNPDKAVALALGGVLPDHKAEAPPPQATILLNDHVLGVLNKVGSFRQTFLVPEGVLGHSHWGELEIHVNKTFNPKQFGFSTDSRDLGVLITDLELLDLELSPEGFIDIGTPEARKHLGDGWSIDERTDELTYVWADALESSLSVALPGVLDFGMDLRLLPSRHPSSWLQVLSVYVNGRYLQDLVLQVGGWQTHSFVLPHAFVRPGINSFRFVYRYAVAPAEIIPHSQDTRPLTVAYDYIRFRQLPTGRD
jgi:hypothetical protein